MTIKSSITNRNSILNKFFNEVDNIELLTASQEIDLAQKIKAGDENAAKQLVRHNIKFIISIAKRYENNGLELSDLINEGCIGMIKAAKKFDETRGFKFISYAVWWVRQAILESISKHMRLIKMPINKTCHINKFNSVYAEMEQQLERTPSADEVMEAYGKKYKDILTKDTYDILMSDSKMRNTLSMDYRSSEESIPLHETIADEDAEFYLPLDINLSYVLKNAITKLNPQEKQVMTLYLEGFNMVKIGHKLGLTRQRIEQVKSKAIKRLKKNNELRELVA